MSETCPNCEKLLERIERLEKIIESQDARIKELESQLRSGKRQAQPFGRDSKKLKSLRKKPGRKKGEGEFKRQNSSPISQTHVFTPLSHCPDCTHPLTRKKRHISYQSDLPQIELETTCFETESGYCTECKRRYRSSAQGQIVTATGSAGHGYGPRLKSLAAYLKHSFGLPFRKIDALIQDAFGVSYCASAQIQAEYKQENKLQQQYKELQKHIRESQQVFVDETGWRVDSQSSWLWVFCNSAATVYTIRADRSHRVILTQLGEGFQCVMHSDCFAAYDAQALRHYNKQKCLAHLQRELSELAQKKGVSRCFGMGLKLLFQDALKVYHAQGPPKNIEQRFKDLLHNRHFHDADNKRILKRLKKLQGQWLQFLSNPNAEPTNNRAERVLKPAVVVRKTGRCNKTQRGADLHAMITSVIVSAQQQSWNAWEYLQSLWTEQSSALPSVFAKPA